MWLLEPSASERMAAIEVTAIALDAEQRAQLLDAANRGRAQSVKISGDIAEIKINGVLTNEPDLFAMLFGGGNTTYKGIISAIMDAEENDKVKRIDFLIDDSPGGHVSGMFAAASAIATTTKPTRAIVDNLAASATYLLASQADELIATNEGARFGSVGVVSTHFTDDSIVEITSSKAPNKRPDVRTDEGRAVIREHLDQVHGLLAATIAKGRGVTERTVNSKFGRGGVMIATEALKADMIDGIGTVASVNNGNTATGGKQKEVVSMDLNELKMKHPDVYAAAVRDGVDVERDRVKAHLTYGERTGAMDVAVKAIRDGLGITAELTAEYLTAGLNRGDTEARQEDNPPDVLTDTVGSVSNATEASALADQVAAAVCRELGGAIDG